MNPAGKPNKPKAGISAGTGAKAAKTAKAWSKPRITRHGNMRQLSQMSG